MARQIKKEKTPSYYPAEAKGILTIALSLLMMLSLISFTDGDASTNFLGLLGYTFAWAIQYAFGLGSYIIVLYAHWLGWKVVRGKEIESWLSQAIYFSIFLFSFCILMSLFAESYPRITEKIAPWIYSESTTLYSPLPYKIIRHNLGGVPFYYLFRDLPHANLQRLLSNVGTTLVFLTTLLTSGMMLTEIHFSHFLSKLLAIASRLSNLTASFFRFLKPSGESGLLRSVKLKISGATSDSHSDSSEVEDFLEITPDSAPAERPSLSKKKPPSKKKTINTSADEIPMNLPKATPIPATTHAPHTSPGSEEYAKYKLPPPSFLTTPRRVDQASLKKSLRRQAEVLEETLMSFGIEAKVGEINCGPTITSFEVHPSIGVKVQKIKALENDIALNLEAQSIRIIAPIPGKAAVGIEVPNPSPQEVSFREMLSTYHQGPHRLEIPILLGKSVHGTHITADLTKMPHCIIAGATGSGKSVCINTIVMSILMNARPDEIKLLMVDPKKVELTPYNSLPHLVAPVITEPGPATAALNWLVKEMELRYEILKQLGVRNISAFNKRKINKDIESALDIEIPDHMPYIVGIIDELADLMMVSSSDIETPIARIAQMARAVGIHLILATQRPSREVITGLIKANFPTRIAFKVASRVNSQIILDEPGAESLLGNGDMLFLPPGSSTLIRTQGAYIRDEDINKTVEHICRQASPNYLISSFDKFSSSIAGAEEEAAPKDALYEEAFKLVRSTGNASTTFLQRKLKIGYARAASLMDQLEDRGVVGPQEGSKPRLVLINLDPPSKEE